MTKPKPLAELSGLVYGVTPLPSEEALPMWKRPIFWALIVAVVFVIVNIIFW
jgi:SSS family solute:Na+ symporter